jgi:DNA-binding NarL/FixJ family response regulator
MQLLVLSQSSSFNRHLETVLSVDNELLFCSSIDEVTKSAASNASAILIHSPSFRGEVEAIVTRLAQLTNPSKVVSPLGIAADHPTLEEMLSFTGLVVHSYFNSYMAGIHYRQMLQFITAGQHWYVPGLLESALRMAKRSMSEVPAGVLTGLTPREHEIAQLLSTGLNNKEIAKQCGITERTVKAHLTKVFEKCGVSDRVSLAILVNARTHNSPPSP